MIERVLGMKTYAAGLLCRLVGCGMLAFVVHGVYGAASGFESVRSRVSTLGDNVR